MAQYDTYRILFSSATNLLSLWHEFDHIGSEERAMDYAARQYLAFLKAGYMFKTAELFNVTRNEMVAVIEGKMEYKNTYKKSKN